MPPTSRDPNCLLFSSSFLDHNFLSRAARSRPFCALSGDRLAHLLPTGTHPAFTFYSPTAYPLLTRPYSHPPLLSPTESPHISALRRGSSQASKVEQIITALYYYSALCRPLTSNTSGSENSCSFKTRIGGYIDTKNRQGKVKGVLTDEGAL